MHTYGDRLVLYLFYNILYEKISVLGDVGLPPLNL